MTEFDPSPDPLAVACRHVEGAINAHKPRVAAEVKLNAVDALAYRYNRDGGWGLYVVSNGNQVTRLERCPLELRIRAVGALEALWEAIQAAIKAETEMCREATRRTLAFADHLKGLL